LKYPVGWPAIALQQARKVLAGLGVKRRVDGIRWGLLLPPWHGRTFDVFLLAVDHLARLRLRVRYMDNRFRWNRALNHPLAYRP
jgi:hypothetical protein